MNKQHRKALYEYLSSTGYVFTKERRREIKKLLQAGDAQPKAEEEILDDPDDNLEPEE